MELQQQQKKLLADHLINRICCSIINRLQTCLNCVSPSITDLHQLSDGVVLIELIELFEDIVLVRGPILLQSLLSEQEKNKVHGDDSAVHQMNKYRTPLKRNAEISNIEFIEQWLQNEGIQIDAQRSICELFDEMKRGQQELDGFFRYYNQIDDQNQSTFESVIRKQQQAIYSRSIAYISALCYAIITIFMRHDYIFRLLISGYDFHVKEDELLHILFYTKWKLTEEELLLKDLEFMHLKDRYDLLELQLNALKKQQQKPEPNNVDETETVRPTQKEETPTSNNEITIDSSSIEVRNKSMKNITSATSSVVTISSLNELVDANTLTEINGHLDCPVLIDFGYIIPKIAKKSQITNNRDNQLLSTVDIYDNNNESTTTKNQLDITNNSYLNNQIGILKVNNKNEGTKTRENEQIKNYIESATKMAEAQVATTENQNNEKTKEKTRTLSHKCPDICKNQKMGDAITTIFKSSNNNASNHHHHHHHHNNLHNDSSANFLQSHLLQHKLHGENFWNIQKRNHGHIPFELNQNHYENQKRQWKLEMDNHNQQKSDMLEKRNQNSNNVPGVVDNQSIDFNLNKLLLENAFKFGNNSINNPNLSWHYRMEPLSFLVKQSKLEQSDSTTTKKNIPLAKDKFLRNMTNDRIDENENEKVLNQFSNKPKHQTEHILRSNNGNETSISNCNKTYFPSSSARLSKSNDQMVQKNKNEDNNRQINRMTFICDPNPQSENDDANRDIQLNQSIISTNVFPTISDATPIADTQSNTIHHDDSSIRSCPSSFNICGDNNIMSTSPSFSSSILLTDQNQQSSNNNNLIIRNRNVDDEQLRNRILIARLLAELTYEKNKNMKISLSNKPEQRSSSVNLEYSNLKQTNIEYI